MTKTLARPHRAGRNGKRRIAGDTQIGELRGIYGESFAQGFGGRVKLKTVIENKSNEAIGDFHGRSAAKAGGDKPAAAKLSSQSNAALALATVAFGPALKRLADK